MTFPACLFFFAAATSIKDAENKVSFFDFIPENTVIWMHEWAFTREKLLEQEADLHSFIANGVGRNPVQGTEPTHTPFWQTSMYVVALLSLHKVPFAMNV